MGLFNAKPINWDKLDDADALKRIEKISDETELMRAAVNTKHRTACLAAIGKIFRDDLLCSLVSFAIDPEQGGCIYKPYITSPFNSGFEEIRIFAVNRVNNAQLLKNIDSKTYSFYRCGYMNSVVDVGTGIARAIQGRIEFLSIDAPTDLDRLFYRAMYGENDSVRNAAVCLIKDPSLLVTICSDKGQAEDVRMLALNRMHDQDKLCQIAQTVCSRWPEDRKVRKELLRNIRNPKKEYYSKLGLPDYMLNPKQDSVMEKQEAVQDIQEDSSVSEMNANADEGWYGMKVKYEK